MLLLLTLLLLFLTLFLLATSKLKLKVLELHRDHGIDVLLILLLDFRHDLIASHLAIVGLFLVLALITICPLLGVILIELVEFLYDFRRANLKQLGTLIIVTTAAFLALASLLGLGVTLLFLSCAGGLVLSSLLLFLFRRERDFKVVTGVEFLKVVGDLASEVLTVFLDPLTALSEHAILDIATLDLHDFVLQVLFLLLESGHMVSLDVLAEELLLVSLIKGIVFLLIFSLGLALHAEENHLLSAHLLNGLASENTTDEALGDLSSVLFVFLLSRGEHLAVVHTLLNVVSLHGTGDLLQRVEVTTATLTTSFVLLDKTNSLHHLDIESERIVCDFFNRFGGSPTIEKSLVDLGVLLVHGEHLLGLLIIVGLLLFLALALLLTALLAFLLFATFALNLFLENDVDGNLIVLLEVAGHGDLNHRRVILQIEEETIKVDVDGARTEVVEDQVLLQLANTADGALEDLLDEDTLLRVHNLIVALFELAVDLDVLNVQHGVVREAFLETPKLAILRNEKMKR